MQKIGFIGCGNIASAIIKGAVGAGVIDYKNITLYDIDPKKTEPFIKSGSLVALDLKELIKKSDTLFLTIKPQILPNLLLEIQQYISDEHLIISPVAGVKIEKINSLLGGSKKIIRVMPNTPLMYSAGATAISRGSGVSDEEFAFAQKIFASCGVTATVDEAHIDTVTGISGSSPAFFMRFAREIINEGVRCGMSPDEAELLVTQTMAGTAKMMAQSHRSVDELISAVASPNGTTEAGLKTMDALAFDDTVAKVISAAINRSKELSK